MVSKTCDVIIVGTGPAGVTAANLLADRGLDVMLMGRGAQQTLQVPETFYGMSHELLVRLKVDQDVHKAIEFPKKIQLISAHEGFNYQIEIERLKGKHHGMGINRPIFDQILIESAIAQGAVYLPNMEIEEFVFEENQLTGVRCRTAEGVIEYGAKIVIDARGNQTPLARRADSKAVKPADREPYISGFAYFVGERLADLIPDNKVLAVALEGGYILAMMLPDGRVSVMVVLSREKLKRDTGNLDQIFQEAIDRWPPLSKAIQAAEKVTPTQSVVNYDWACDRYSGNRFLIVGDAVAFLDPFFCNGVAIGMNAGEIAADFVIQGLAKGNHLDKAEYFSSYEQQIHALIQKWERVWGIEKMSLCSIGLLKQTIGLLGQLSFLKLGAVNEELKKKNPLFDLTPVSVGS